MILRSVSSLWLIVVLFWPTQAEEIPATLEEFKILQHVEAAATANYLTLLERRGVSLAAQGIRIESLDGDFIFADHNSGWTFNPASVIKIATSLAALEQFGPEHRFETAFLIDGEIIGNGVLAGDLILYSDGDPEAGTNDLVRLAREVMRAGVRRVEGRFIISGPFTVGNLHRRAQVDRYVVQTLRRTGLRVPDQVHYGTPRGALAAQSFSRPLRDIVFELNAHSTNTTADRLGEAVGGPQGVQYYLRTHVGIPAEDLYISHASGLRINRITPAGTIMVLRKLAYWLEERGMYPEDVLPVAGRDRGTLRLRFTNAAQRGAVVAKTGTLISTDAGVSTLAGVLYTRDHGPLLFAIFNTRGPVTQYRDFQDRYVRELLAEFGGMPLAETFAHRMER